MRMAEVCTLVTSHDAKLKKTGVKSFKNGAEVEF